MASPKHRVETQALFREVNQRVRELADVFASTGDDVEFVCECGDLHCTEMLTLSVVEYEAARSSPTRFLVARGHDDPSVVRTVVENEGFLVVETLGVLGKASERLARE